VRHAPAAWATWDDGVVDMWSLRDEGQVLHARLTAVPRERRYQVSMRATPSGGLLVRAPEGSGTQVWSVDPGGQPARRYDLGAEVSALPPWSVRLLPHGRVAGIGSGDLVLRADSEEERISPPEGFAVRDMTADEDGALWVCGSRDGHRSWATRSGRSPWVLGRGATGLVSVAWRAALAGAVRRFDRIEWVAGWLVLCSEAGAVEDSTAFVFARSPGGRWSSTRFAHDSLRAVAPAPSGIVAWSHGGRVVRFEDARWRRGRRRPQLARGAIAAAQEALSAPSTARVEVLGVAADGETVLAGVRSRGTRVGEALLACDAAAAVAAPAAAPVRVLAHQRSAEPEVVAAEVCAHAAASP